MALPLKGPHGYPFRVMRYLYGLGALQLVVLLKCFIQLPPERSLVSYVPHSFKLHESHITDWSLRSHASNKLSGTRIAVLMTYTGTQLPAWFPAFVASCRSPSSIADWLIFHDGVRAPYGLDLPENVQLIDLGKEGFAERLSSVIPEEYEAERAELRAGIMAALRRAPYMLIQFKPALGWIFRDYLSGYTHWAFADLDVLMGDLRRFVGPRELQHYDAITLSFGDQFRAYTRGQLTIFQKADWSLEGFRLCPYLQPQHLLPVLKGKDPRDASTEGCFSFVLSQSTDLRVLYLPGLFSDANLPEHDYREDGSNNLPPADAGFHEALVLSDGRVLRCSRKSQLIEDCLGSVLALPPPPLKRASTNIQDPKAMLRSFLLAPSVLVEEVQVAENATALDCMWWVAGDYQLCLTGTDAHDELVRSDGRFYKLQHGSSLQSRFPHWLAGTVEAGMMHFQEWKKAYPYWSVPSAGAGYAGTLVTELGFIPLPWPPAAAPAPSGKQARAAPAEPEDARFDMAEAVRQRGSSSSPGRYCTAFSEAGGGLGQPPMPRCKRWAYGTEPVRVGALASPGKESTQALTLLMLARGPADLPAIAHNRQLWGGPMVVVALVADGPLPPDYDRLLGPAANTSSSGSSTLVVPFRTPLSTGGRLPIKAMLNAGMDHVLTRWALPLDRPSRLSPDTFDLLHHATTRLPPHQRGAAILLPELSSHDESSSDATGSHKAAAAAHLGCGTEEEAFLSAGVVSHWRALQQDKRGLPVPIDDRLLRLPPTTHMRMANVAALGSPGRAAPAMLLDLMGPHGPLYLRWLEELGGRSCYDSLLLVSVLRLLDYRPFLVPGAFLEAPAAPPAQQQQEEEAAECGCAVRDASGPVKLYLRRLARQQSLHHAVAISTRSWQDQGQGRGGGSSTTRHK